MTISLKAEDLGLHEEEALDVLDLPQLYTRPCAAALLSTLSDLKSQPSSWGSTPQSCNSRSISGASTPCTKRRKIKSEGVPAYLTKIVSSALQWIDDDAQKEQIWETASHELSVRSGRTGQGDLARTFVIPLSSISLEKIPTEIICPNEEDMAELYIYEPALTADNLGHKTWAASFVLAKRLCQLKPDLPLDSILELGAGTGLVGMAAACVLKASVVMTDLPAIIPNLQRNLHDNAATINANGGAVLATALDWRRPEILLIDGEKCAAQCFSLILAADTIYSKEHPQLLTDTIRYHLRRTLESRLVLEAPIRDAYDADLSQLCALLSSEGLVMSQEGREIGVDDWSNRDDEELAEVQCWWSVWKWSQREHVASTADEFG